MKVTPQFGNRRYRTKLRYHLGFPTGIPLINLCFLLLLFIVMTSSVVRLSGIRVDLPRVNAPTITGSRWSVVTVTAPGNGQNSRIYFRDQLCSPAILRQELAAMKDRAEQILIIRADKNVPSGILDEVMAIAEEAHIASFLAVQKPVDRPETRFE